MRARRRFHGYCPPAARRTTNIVMFSSPDDYTSNLNARARVDSKVMPLTEIILKSNDSICRDDDDISVTAMIRSVIFRKSPTDDGLHDITDFAIQSLSCDSRDESFKLRASKENEKRLPCDDVSGTQNKELNSIENIKTLEGFIPESISIASEASDDNSGGPPTDDTNVSFFAFRLNYLVITTAIMLADGLQGTHLYVLYEGYGYSVASLYCLGFVTGAVTSPITGPLVDKLGRKKAALLYCALEIGINVLEQYPVLAGLILSRMVGGITTNLLSSVFEAWLDTEYKRRGFDDDKYEIIMRDSVIVSNLAAIGSGYFAHHLAERLGPVGPFKGAVTCTTVALAVVAAVWTENYGSSDPGIKSCFQYLSGAYKTFKSDSKILRVGLIQGLTCGSIQIFIFLWSPVLREFARSSRKNAIGLDAMGEPAYGLIFSSFMACGVLGGLAAPIVRTAVTKLLTPKTGFIKIIKIDGEGEIRPMAVEFLAATCYMICGLLLLTPYLLSQDGEFSFIITLASFVIYEFIVGVYMPCEGVIRSLYIPSDSRCSLMTLPRIIVNVSVSVGVIATNYISVKNAFLAVSMLMLVSAMLQVSLISSREWTSVFGKVKQLKKSLSLSVHNNVSSLISLHRGLSVSHEETEVKEKTQ